MKINEHAVLKRIAEKFGVPEAELLETLKATAFRQKGDDPQITDAQMVALMIVADQYGLNPFTKELYAYPDKKNGGIVPVVSVDGWSRIINEHPMMDGVEFRYAEKEETKDGARPCPAWCESVFKRKDRSQPIVVREYLDECFRKLDYRNPWQTHTKRFLRHKAFIQGARMAFGFGGIYDDDEAERILDANAIEGNATRVHEATPITMPRAIAQNAGGEPVPAGATIQGTRQGEKIVVETGEVKKDPSAQQADQAATPAGNGGAKANQGMLAHLRKKIDAAKAVFSDKAVTEEQLKKDFGVERLEDLTIDQVNAALEKVRRQGE